MLAAFIARGGNLTKALVLGLDGATWDIILPLAHEGRLPHIGGMIREGTSGDLESTIPPVTGAAWFAMATGRNPGKTGAYDFIVRKGADYHLVPVSSRHIAGSGFWDYLSDEGRTVGIVSFPMLFPPYPINGFMVSNVNSLQPQQTTFPPELKDKLHEAANGYENFVYSQDQKYNDEDRFLDDLHRVLGKQAKGISYLIQQQWDLFFAVISCIDQAQHVMWKHVDESHPLHDPARSPQYRERLFRFLSHIDEVVGSISRLAGDGCNVFLVSDHGFGSQDECFNLPLWLEQKGYLVRRASPRLADSIRKGLWGSRYALSWLTKCLPQTLSGWIVKAFRPHVIQQLDLEKSMTVVCGHTIPFGAIYLNVEGRDKHGCVSAHDYDSLKREIMDRLRHLGDDIGKDVAVDVFDSQLVYQGDYVDRAPDIIFTVDDFRCIVNEEDFDDVLFRNQAYSNRHTGSHRMNGILLACGPEIKQGSRIEGASIYDIAPTLLHMFGAAIPVDMDGRVLTEIFKEDSEAAKRPTIYQPETEARIVKRKIRKLKASGKA